MNIQSVCNNIDKQLTEFGYKVNLVQAKEISRELLTHSMLDESVIVYGFEFIVNDNRRFISFGIIHDNDILFTRAKTGSINHLATLIKQRDFNFTLSGDIYSRNDLIGKFIETMINQEGRTEMETWFEKARKEAFKRWGTEFHICLGFRITRYHKVFNSFDAAVEIQVRPESEVRYTTYTGKTSGATSWVFYDESGAETNIEAILSI